MATTLSYRLPLSCIRISGTETTKDDRVLGRTDKELEAAGELSVIADPRGPDSVELDPGSFRNTDASFKLTEDGRLTSANATVTGQGGAFISGLVGIATTVVAALARAPISLATAVDTTKEAADDARANVVEADKDADEKKIEAAYLEQQKVQAEARTSARTLVKPLDSAYRGALDEVANAESEETRAAALRKVRQLNAARSLAGVLLDRSEALFQAWRAGTITAATQTLTYEITLDELRMSDVYVDDDGEVRYPVAQRSPQHQLKVAAAQAKARTAWERLGVLVVVQDDPRDEEPSYSIPPDDRMKVKIRFPRPVVLGFYKKNGEGKAQFESLRPAMVVDGASRVESIEVNAGWFGKHSGGITFSADGIPTGFDFGNSSEAVGAITALAALPAGVATSLETAAKISDQLDGLRNKSLDHELARTKKAVELQEQQLTKKGLDATEADYAKLVRLKQEADIMDKETALGRRSVPPDPVAAEIAELKRQVELLRLRQQLDRLDG